MTLVLATTPSPIDASLVPTVIRYSVGFYLCRPHLLSNYDSSNTCSTEGNIDTSCHDAEEMLHFYVTVFFKDELSKKFVDVSEFSTASCVQVVKDFR